MILNKKQLIDNAREKKQKRVRRDLLAILEFVLRSIDPYQLVKQNLKLKKNTLHIANELSFDLDNFKHIYVCGAGKAVYKMALALEAILGKRLTCGLINIPSFPKKNELKSIEINKARHPTPNIAGVRGSKKIKKMLEGAGAKDLVIGVISGGGSALLPLPAEGITLEEKIKLTSQFLKTPATIHEINVVRKHLSQIKGGQFTCYAYPATLITLYISDIVDDPFDIQASGPTAPDPSTFNEAIKVLKKYNIWQKAPKNIRKRLLKGQQGLIPETPNIKHKVFSQGKVYNFTIGNHETALISAYKQAKKLGYNVLEMSSSLEGEAREVSKVIISIGKQIKRYSRPLKKPALILAAGETTVSVKGKGQGGRNQELVLSGLGALQKGMTLVSFGTDGVDGLSPKPIAGALGDLSTKERALKLKLDLQDYLARNDSYHFFEKIGDNIKTGYTGTNVGDLILLSVV